MPYTGTPRTWAAGATVTAAQMNSDVRDPLNGLALAWTAYTPTIGGTGWAIGNGTATGFYAQMGKTVVFEASVTFGTTSTFGSAALTFGLPVTAASTVVRAHFGVAQHGAAIYAVWGSSGGGSIAMTVQTVAQPGANVISTVPFTWASGDSIRFSGVIQAA